MAPELIDAIAALLNLPDYPNDDSQEAIDKGEEVSRLLGGKNGMLVFPEIYLCRYTLRSMVDEWIDSGIDSDGNERPRSRHLDEGFLVVPAELENMTIDGRLITVVKTGSRIRQIVESCLRRHPIWPLLKNGGGVEMTFNAPQPAWPRESEDPYDWKPRFEGEPPMPEAHVAMLFVQFFRSRWIFRLMRCARCRRYQPVNAPRAVYEYGWHCARCRRSAPALRSMKRERKQRKERLLRLCAEAWFKSRLKVYGRYPWMIERVNSQMPRGAHIRRNFITRNLTEIQGRAEELHKAKDAEWRQHATR